MGGTYKTVEQRLLEAVHLRFSLSARTPVALGRQIKAADRTAAFFEAVNLAGFEVDDARKWFGEPSIPGFDLDNFESLIRPWPTQEAHDRFISVFEAVSAAVQA
jgi:hypothetical protein